jgi:hypothetical protein
MKYKRLDETAEEQGGYVITSSGDANTRDG